MQLTPQDVAACIVAVVIVIGIVVLALFSRPIPPELGIASGSAITWLFVRTTQAATYQAQRNGHE